MRRPFYPIAKPEIDNKFEVNIYDQLRMGENFADLFNYMDVRPVNITAPGFNATEIVEVISEVAEKATDTPNVLNLVSDFKEDIRTLTNLTRLIEQTPIKDFTEELIAWDAIERLLVALGLQDVIQVEVVKEYVQSVEDTLLDPN